MHSWNRSSLFTQSLIRVNKTQLIDMFMKQSSATLWPELLANAASFKLFFKTRFRVAQNNAFFKFTLELSVGWVWVTATIPKMYWSETLNECKVCKCAVTASSAVSEASLLGGRGDYTTDESWHRVLDEALLIKSMYCMFAECHHGGCVTFFLQSTIGVCVGFVVV